MSKSFFSVSVGSTPHFELWDRLHFYKNIASIVYLRNWALIAPIIVFRFLLNLRPFLLEAIGVTGLGLLPFQVHLMLFRKLVPLFE
jgi:hypothetical protein